MQRKTDVVPILIDSKNELKNAVDGLGGRVTTLDRELRSSLTASLVEMRENDLNLLRNSQQETRASANTAARKAGEAIIAVTELRRDIDRLHHGLDALRQDVGQVLTLLQAGATTAAVASSATGPYDAESDTGHTEAVLPRQRMAALEEAPFVGAPGSLAVAVESGNQGPPAPQEGADERAVRENDPESEQPTEQEKTSAEHEAQHADTEGAESAGRNEEIPEPYPLSGKGRIWAILRAGRVASASLVCHRDTWEFVAAKVGNHPHFRPPTLEDRGEGLVAAALSGRSLMAMLLSLYHVRQSPKFQEDAESLEAYADWALAGEVYTETARVLRNLTSGEGGPVVVTLDYRVRATA